MQYLNKSNYRVVKSRIDALNRCLHPLRLERRALLQQLENPVLAFNSGGVTASQKKRKNK
jgi:hypothetical protein